MSTPYSPARPSLATLPPTYTSPLLRVFFAKSVSIYRPHYPLRGGARHSLSPANNPRGRGRGTDEMCVNCAARRKDLVNYKSSAPLSAKSPSNLFVCPLVAGQIYAAGAIAVRPVPCCFRWDGARECWRSWFLNVFGDCKKDELEFLNIWGCLLFLLAVNYCSGVLWSSWHTGVSVLNCPVTISIGEYIAALSENVSYFRFRQTIKRFAHNLNLSTTKVEIVPVFEIWGFLGIHT